MKTVNQEAIGKAGSLLGGTHLELCRKLCRKNPSFSLFSEKLTVNHLWWLACGNPTTVSGCLQLLGEERGLPSRQQPPAPLCPGLHAYKSLPCTKPSGSAALPSLLCGSCTVTMAAVPLFQSCFGSALRKTLRLWRASREGQQI